MISSSNRWPSISIRWKIPILVVTPLVTAVGLTGWLAFRNGEQAVNDLAQQLSGKISSEINKEAQIYLEKPLLINQVNAAVIRSGNVNLDNFQELERYFWNQVRQPNFASYVYFGDEQGKFIGVERGSDDKTLVKLRDESTGSDLKTYNLDRPGHRGNSIGDGKRFDPRTRPWYEAAKKVGQPTWSKVYPFASGIPGITAATPIIDDTGKLRGVLGTDLSLQQISEFLRNLEISKSGKKSGEAFILTPSRQIVGSSVPETKFVGAGQQVLEATDSSQPLIVQRTVLYLLSQFSSLDRIGDKKIISGFVFNGEPQLINVSLLKNGQGVNWLIVVVIPESDFLEDFYRSALFTLFLGLMITGVAAVLGLIAAYRLNKPIVALTDAAAAMETGTFDPQSLETATQRGDELGQLARIFQRMGNEVYDREQQLKQHVEKLDNEIGKYKKERQVAELNERYYFLELIQKSKSLRER